MELEKEIMELVITEKVDENIKVDENRPLNPILEEYKKKYNPEELTHDGIPTIETQLREIKEDEEKQKLNSKYNDEQKYKREMLQRVKCLSLNRMGKSIFTNTFDMKPSDRKKLQEIMWSFNDIDHEEIIKEFNELVCEDYLDNVKEIDYSRLPVYDI